MDKLNGMSAKSVKRILLVWVFAMMWMYVGNIINFHQHHIWGKQLIPVALTSNRSKEKSLVKYQDNCTQLSFAGHFTVFISGAVSMDDLPVSTTVSRISIPPPFISASPSHISMGLRAPPVA